MDAGEGLLLMAESGDVEKLKSAVRKSTRTESSLDVYDAQGWTPLGIAAFARWTDGVAVLLAAGASVDFISPPFAHQWTPLMIAAGVGAEDVVVALLAAGAQPGHRDETGLAALDMACHKSHPRVARRLVQALEDEARKGLDARDGIGRERGAQLLQRLTMEVAAHGLPQRVSVLLRAGIASMAHSDSKDGAAAMMNASLSSSSLSLDAAAEDEAFLVRTLELCDREAKHETVGTVLSFSLWRTQLRTALPGSSPCTPLALRALYGAARQDLPGIIEALLEAGVAADTADVNNEYTALYHAVARNAVKAIEALLRGGAVASVLVEDARTLLMVAAREDADVLVAEMLLRAGVSPLAKDAAGRMAADYAKSDDFRAALSLHVTVPVAGVPRSQPLAIPSPSGQSDGGGGGGSPGVMDHSPRGMNMDMGGSARRRWAEYSSSEAEEGFDRHQRPSYAGISPIATPPVSGRPPRQPSSTTGARRRADPSPPGAVAAAAAAAAASSPRTPKAGGAGSPAAPKTGGRTGVALANFGPVIRRSIDDLVAAGVLPALEDDKIKRNLKLLQDKGLEHVAAELLQNVIEVHRTEGIRAPTAFLRMRLRNTLRQCGKGKGDEDAPRSRADAPPHSRSDAPHLDDEAGPPSPAGGEQAAAAAAAAAPPRSVLKRQLRDSSRRVQELEQSVGELRNELRIERERKARAERARGNRVREDKIRFELPTFTMADYGADDLRELIDRLEQATERARNALKRAELRQELIN